MVVSTDGKYGECSGIKNLKDLLQKTKNKYQELHINDKRWPCPFCLTKSSSIITCKIHITQDHPNIAKANTQEFLSQFESSVFESSPTIDEQYIICKRCTTEKKCKGIRGLKLHYSSAHKQYKDEISTLYHCSSNISDNSSSINDLIKFLDQYEKDVNLETSINENDIQGNLKKCIYCPPELSQKLYVGDKGLRIHFSKQHKDIETTIDSSESHTSSKEQSKFANSSSNAGRVECEFCPGKFFKIPNGIKIHKASCNGTIANNENTSNMDDFLGLLAKYKMEVKVVKRIPNGARTCVAQKYTEVINKCVEENSLTSWQDLFLFPYRILSVADKKKKNDKTSLTSKIKKNVINNNRSPIISISLKKSNKSTSKYIESKVFDGDIRGAIRILASDDNLLKFDIAIFDQLKEKHGFEPPVLDQSAQPDIDQPVTEVTAEETSKSIYSFRNGSAGGIDGLRPQHLKDLLAINNESKDDSILRSLTNLSNFMLAGKVNVKFLSVIYGASLIALSKKDGGIRPIAIGCTYRRLVSKLACKDISDELSSILKPKQLGFSVKGGCEAAVHAARLFIECNDGAEMIVKVDVRNAFNSVFRSVMLQKVKEKFPRIYPYIYQCYAYHSNLFFGDWKIDSATGCQQGDPLGPPLFCLVINECIQELISELNEWYLDDGTLGGRGENVIKDLTHIKQKFSLLGLELNSSKCELYFLPNVTEERKNELLKGIEDVLPGIKVLSDSELTLLGAPLTSNAVGAVVEAKMKVLSNFFRKLSDLHPHVALYLLQHCLWIPKFTYLLRCCPLFNFMNYLKVMDDGIKNILEEILNIQLTGEGLVQCFLPIKLGGLGIRLLSDIALPAFLASFNSSFDLVTQILPPSINTINSNDFINALNKWKSMCPNDEVPLNINMQDCWDLPLINEKIRTIPGSTQSTKARLLAVSQKESGAWLQALPSPFLGTLLDLDSLRIASGLRLGVKVCKPYTCICGYPVDEFGTHGLSCIKKKGTFSRHFIMNDLILKGLSTAGFPSFLEPTGLIRKDGKRADGMTITPWWKGKNLVWDATCVDTLASSYLHLTSKNPGAAANEACIRKERLYGDIVLNHHFVPFAVETFGSFSNAAKSFINKLGPILNKKSGNVHAKSFFIQKISLAIQRGNVAGIIGSIPPTSKLKEIFYLND